MAKLISLEGATITVPQGWTATSGYGIFSFNGYGNHNGYPLESGIYFQDQSSIASFRIGYSGDFDGNFSQKANTIWFGPLGDISNRYEFAIKIIDGRDITNQNLIQWFLDNDATIEGGVWEEEDIPRIIYNNQVIAELGDSEVTILCAGKKMLSDIVIVNPMVNEAEEEVKLGTINYYQTSTWSSVPIHRSFEIGMTWEEFINSDYNKVQNDVNGSITISGQFILSGNYVKFYGKRTNETTYRTLNVTDAYSSIVKINKIRDGNIYYSTIQSQGGGSN